MQSLTNPVRLNRRTALCLSSGGIASALSLGAAPAGAAQEATLEANKATVRRLFAEPLAAGNAENLRGSYSTHFLERGAWSQHVPDLAGTSSTIVTFRESHPQLTVTLDALTAEADLVATVATWRGSHPPAGMHIVGRTMHLFRLAGGQISEQWNAGWEGPSKPSQHMSPIANPLAVVTWDQA